MIVCPSCGFEAPDDFAFCPKCATALSAPLAIPEERKVVTTLFCDLVAFTAMSEAADPEDVDRLLNEYSSRARRAIESHGGTVEKFIGDAVVGVFGVPVAHEDDPERAVRAALRLLEKLDAAGLVRPDGMPLLARCGVNTGEALARLDVDPLSGRGFVTGDAVNTAARLQAAAPPMGVAVGELTHELTAAVIAYEELPPVSAKGKSKPLCAWLARRPVARTGLRTTGLTSTPFLERGNELLALEDALSRASRAGEMEMVLIVGEPGIGKSRLVLELAHCLDEHPEMVTWRQGRCLPYGEGVTFWPLSEILKAHAGILDTDGVATVEARLDAVLPQSADRAWLRQRLRPLLGLSTTQSDRDESFAAWTRMLELIAADGPSVLVLEDLHWAGEAMLVFVEHLLSRELEIPLLIVATARPELLEHHEGALTLGSDHLQRITLPPLSQAATGALVTCLLDARPGAEMGPRILDLVGGNPLYAEQYVRLLLDGDFVAPAPDGLRLASGLDLPVPETVQAVLAARLDTLPRGHKALLCDASVVGETFWLGAVAALAGQDAGTVGAAMSALVGRDLVRPVLSSSMEGETQYLFWHALTRDVAYGQLPRGVRARKHTAVATWIEEATGERSHEFAEILAHHYETALDLARAVGDEELATSLAAPTLRCLSLAGQRALRLDATSAERHLIRALELAEPDGAERLELLPRLAEAFFLTNRLRQAAAVLEEAVAGLKKAGDVRAAAVSMCMLAHTLPRLGESDRGLTRSAVDLLAGDEPSPEKAEVLGMHALSVAIENTDTREVLAAADQAIEICELLRLPEPAIALHCRGDARLTLGDLDGFEDYERAVAAARAQGLGRERATIEGNRVAWVFALEGPRAACRATVEVMKFARRHGLETYAMNGRTLLIAGLRDAGEWDRALEEAADILSLIETDDDVADALYLMSFQAHILAERGDAARIARVLPWVVEKGREATSYIRGNVLLGAALAYAQIGEADSALRLLSECLDAPAAVLGNQELVPCAVRAALSAGDQRLAVGFLSCIAAGTPIPALPLYQHVSTSVRALVAEAHGDDEAAAEGFADAAGRWRTFEMPYEEGQALLGMGRCLARLGRRAEAVEALDRARGLLARLKARPALEETDSLLSSVPRA